MNKKITYIIYGIDKAVFFELTALALKEKGFELSFILINCESKALDSFLTKNGFTIKHLTIKKTTKSLSAIIECRHHLKKIKPAAIHCHLGPANTVGLLAGYLAGIKKRVYTQHLGLPLHRSAKDKLLDALHNKLATDIVAISKNVKEILIDQKVKEEKITVIHHGFDIARMMHPDLMEIARIKRTYNAGNRTPIIGVVARWLELKGIQYIIPAFKKILSQYPNAKFCLFNATEAAEYGKEIKAMLNELPPESYIAVPFEYNVYDLYQLFDIYVHVPINPSCEAFGQTYVEALAAGIPSIFTMSGVAREFIIDRKNALVVDFKNSEEIFERIVDLLTNSDIKKTITENGKKDVTKLFSLEYYTQKLEALYEKNN